MGLRAFILIVALSRLGCDGPGRVIAPDPERGHAPGPETQPGPGGRGHGRGDRRSRRGQARARFLPTVNFAETYNFSDNPTQVFMSKLNQRVFTSQDFLLNNLNNPNAYGNFRAGW